MTGTQIALGGRQGSAGSRGVGALAWDLVGLGVAAGMVVALAAGPPVYQLIFAEQSHVVLTVASAAVGAAAAILGDIATRLSRDPRPSWIAAALALYCVVLLPSTTAWATLGETTVAVKSVRMVAFLTVAALLILAIRPPPRLGTWGGWIIAGLGVLLSVVVGQLAGVLPETFRALTSPALISVLALGGWGAAAVGLGVLGCRRGQEPLRRVGLGLLLVAAAHLYRGTVGLEVSATDLAFDLTRLLGLGMVLIGLAQLSSSCIQRIRSERLAHDEDLQIASAHMQRAAQKTAERDHELRNGLSGLWGVTDLLSSSVQNADQERLRSAVLHELARLAAMLEDARPGGAAPGYDVGTVLDDLVTLRRASGAVVELEVAAGLRADGTPAVLAQVVTNLLANSARHAPGSAVRIRGGPCGKRVIVEISDDGPGIGPGQENLVLERGVRHPQTGGTGLGLHVSRQLLASEGARLRLLPTTPGQGGCTVVVELPRPGPWSESAAEPEPSWGPAAPGPALDPERWSAPVVGLDAGRTWPEPGGLS